MSTNSAISNSTKLPDEVDVIVVGSGAAALTGAYTAATHGMSVLVLEKTRYLGGTCAYAGAGLWFPGNKVLAEEGIVDDVESGVTYFRATVGDRTPRDLQEAFVRTGTQVVDFLRESKAMEFTYLPFPDYFNAPGRAKPTGRAITPAPIRGADLGEALEAIRPTSGPDKFGQEEPRDVLTGGQSLIGQLLLALGRTGLVDIRVESPMSSLIVVDGVVTGVVAAGQEVRARKGVIVGAGGYDGDDARRQEHHGLPNADWTSAPTGANTGDALAALQAVGADIDLLDEAWWAPGVLFPNGAAGFFPIVRGGIFVASNSKRFANEALPYDQFGHKLLKEMRAHGAGTEFWWIFDSRGEVPGVVVPPMDLEEFEESGHLLSAPTLEELAKHLGLDPATLRETVGRFNEDAANGVDTEFGRGVDDFDMHFAVGNGLNPALTPLDTPPYRAVRLVLSDLGSKGGARTGVNAEVLDANGSPIPGLYAVGNSAASVAGNVYPGPGVPIGSGMVFAFRAVLDIVNSSADEGASQTVRH